MAIHSPNEECKASYSDYFRNNPDSDVEVINDHEIDVHMRQRPVVDFDYWVSGYRGLPIYPARPSGTLAVPVGATQYEQNFCAAGEPTVEAEPARTGPYQYVNFEKGVAWEYERVSYDHYRVNPDFQELEIRLVKEPATRLAIMLAREGYIAEGLDVSNSQVMAVRAEIFIGGLFYDSSLLENFDPDVPWAAPGEQGRKVRMAMNKALDRDQITNAIFAGLGKKTYVSALHAAFKGGYNPKWDESWEELYGYDPERARELLVEAGYPEGFEVPIKVFILTGVPEMPDYLEAAAAMWQSIGLKPKLEEMEFARWREKYRAAETNCCVYGFRGSALPTAIRVHFAYSAERFMRFYVSDSVTEKRNRALNSTDLEASDVLWAEITDELFYSISGMPLPALPAQATIDPEVVEEYVFLGPNGGFFVYLDYVKAVRK
jgi:ABC-type transport system substrate-binding protein